MGIGEETKLLSSFICIFEATENVSSHKKTRGMHVSGIFIYCPHFLIISGTLESILAFSHSPLFSNWNSLCLSTFQLQSSIILSPKACIAKRV
jgi:hypothetical protein